MWVIVAFFNDGSFSLPTNVPFAERKDAEAYIVSNNLFVDNYLWDSDFSHFAIITKEMSER